MSPMSLINYYQHLILMGKLYYLINILTHTIIARLKRLHDSVWKIEGDRIVAGTYSTAVMAAGGNISLKEVNTKQLKLPLELLRKAGANVREEEFSLHISMKDRPKALSVCTGPYPEFPTDLQSPFMAFLACAKGESRIRRLFQ